jgi:hypothetical protein
LVSDRKERYDLREYRESGHLSAPNRKTTRADDEARVLLHTTAIRQSAHATQSAFRPIAGRVRVVLRQDWQTRQEADVAAEMVMLIREQVARTNVYLFCMDIGRAFAIRASMNLQV